MLVSTLDIRNCRAGYTQLVGKLLLGEIRLLASILNALSEVLVKDLENVKIHRRDCT